jgi:amino acid transporter
VCLIFNRTIGTGIFAQPSNVLYLTGSPAVSIILWIFGGLVILCITLSWLELGLTIPRYVIEGDVYSAPRSGGDKNYLEYIYKRPRLFISCVFGITFVVFGNLAGNSIQFGIYMQAAISPQCTEDDACFNKTYVILWAIGVLSLCSFLNIATRSFLITLNNFFAIAKCLLIVTTALLGIIYGSVHGDGCRKNIAWSNQGAGGEFGDIVLAMFYAMYSYTGFEQPFYVLAEVKQPQKIFAKYVLGAMAFIIVLFPLTNVGFLCVVPYQGSDSVPKNMALKFFQIIAQGEDASADTSTSQRVISVILAFVILGTVMAQTFTGTRVKQEIGKEAILPFSLEIAWGSDSLIARLTKKGIPRDESFTDYIKDHPEQVPMAATLLHIIFAILLVVLVGATTKPTNAYRILTYLRVFTIIVVLGLLTVAGLAYLRIDSWWHGISSNIEENKDGNKRGGRRWLEKRQWPQNPWPWLGALPPFMAAAILAFMSMAVFVKPSQIRPDERNIPSWAYPLTGWLCLGLGILWWAVLRYWQWKTRTFIVVTRITHLDVDGDGNARVVGESIKHEDSQEMAGPADDTIELVNRGN